MSSEQACRFDYLVVDIGSTFTKQRLFRDGFLKATAQTPTTVDDVYRSVAQGRGLMENQLGKTIAAREVLSSSSAAGGLRMVAVGYMARVTAKAAKEVAMNSGAKILEIISQEDPADYRIQILQEIKPDIILLAGGTDYGDEDSILQNAGLIVESGVKSMVVIAGNIAAQPRVQAVLNAGGVPCVRVPNIMPTIHRLVVDKARETIHREFIKQITKAEGLERFRAELTSERVIPTPGAVLLAAELLAKGTYREEGLGELMVIDLGGATTDVHSVVPAYAELDEEEIGLIVTNSKQVSYRTVEGNLGMRVSAMGVTYALDPRLILARHGIKDSEEAERFTAYCQMLESDTGHIAENEKEYEYDTWLAETAVETAVKRHAGYIVTEPDPITGASPGMPVGRDLRHVRTVIAVGGIFAHRSASEGAQIIRRAFKNKGISLLPEEIDVVIDKDYLLYACGVIGMHDELYAFEVLKNYFIKNLCQSSEMGRL